VIKKARQGRDGTVRITFVLPADEPAGAVSVVGDFNDWNPFANPLRRPYLSGCVETPGSPGFTV